MQLHLCVCEEATKNLCGSVAEALVTLGRVDADQANFEIAFRARGPHAVTVGDPGDVDVQTAARWPNGLGRAASGRWRGDLGCRLAGTRRCARICGHFSTGCAEKSEREEYGDPRSPQLGMPGV